MPFNTKDEPGHYIDQLLEKWRTDDFLASEHEDEDERTYRREESKEQKYDRQSAARIAIGALEAVRERLQRSPVTEASSANTISQSDIEKRFDTLLSKLSDVAGGERARVDAKTFAAVVTAVDMYDKQKGLKGNKRESGTAAAIFRSAEEAGFVFPTVQQQQVAGELKESVDKLLQTGAGATVSTKLHALSDRLVRISEKAGLIPKGIMRDALAGVKKAFDADASNGPLIAALQSFEKSLYDVRQAGLIRDMEPEVFYRSTTTQVFGPEGTRQSGEEPLRGDPRPPASNRR